MFGEMFLSLPENQFLRNIFSDAGRCIRFWGKEASELSGFMYGIAAAKG
jgi:hypothetical protein